MPNIVDQKKADGKSKYDGDPVECRNLSKIISEGKKFIICFGQNKDGELGLGNYKEALKDPRTVQLNIDDLNSAQSISSGSHHSALVTKTGDILVCGSTLHGKLGIPDM